MAAELEGKIALVTGASRGIGRAVALRLAELGAAVLVHYRSNAPAAEAVAARIGASGGIAFALDADLADARGPEVLYHRVDELLTRHFGSKRFDILVNNAAAGHRALLEQVTEEEFDHTLALDLRAPFFLIQRASSRLRDGGRIINVSSMATRAAYPSMAAYAPAKAGLEALTLLLAAHFGPRNITVNAVRPGATATDMNPAARDPEQGREVAKSIALGRVGQPDDVADVIAFLATERARWVTGQVIDASGGQRL